MYYHDTMAPLVVTLSVDAYCAALSSMLRSGITCQKINTCRGNLEAVYMFVNS